eukprot:m.171221 g.171221  ORF g.171221 m.171221 type:complete len:306 (-) comp24224_c0_seq4:113-1030(-)
MVSRRRYRSRTGHTLGRKVPPGEEDARGCRCTCRVLASRGGGDTVTVGLGHCRGRSPRGNRGRGGAVLQYVSSHPQNPRQPKPCRGWHGVTKAPKRAEWTPPMVPKPFGNQQCHFTGCEMTWVRPCRCKPETFELMLVRSRISFYSEVGECGFEDSKIWAEGLQRCRRTARLYLDHLPSIPWCWCLPAQRANVRGRTIRFPRCPLRHAHVRQRQSIVCVCDIGSRLAATVYSQVVPRPAVGDTTPVISGTDLKSCTTSVSSTFSVCSTAFWGLSLQTARPQGLLQLSDPRTAAKNPESPLTITYM